LSAFRIPEPFFLQSSNQKAKTELSEIIRTEWFYACSIWHSLHTMLHVTYFCFHCLHMLHIFVFHILLIKLILNYY